MNKDFDALKNIHKIHMIGIGGVSMSGIALILKKMVLKLVAQIKIMVI